MSRAIVTCAASRDCSRRQLVTCTPSLLMITAPGGSETAAFSRRVGRRPKPRRRSAPSQNRAGSNSSFSLSTASCTSIEPLAVLMACEVDCTCRGETLAGPLGHRQHGLAAGVTCATWRCGTVDVDAAACGIETTNSSLPGAPPMLISAPTSVLRAVTTPIERRRQLREAFQRLDAIDVGLQRIDLRLLGGHVAGALVDLLLGHGVRLQQPLPALGGARRQRGVAARGRQLGLGLPSVVDRGRASRFRRAAARP